MILTGAEIAAEVAAGRITIDGYDPRRLEPNSYGFRLGSQILSYDTDTLDCALTPPSRQERIGAAGMVLQPRRVYLGSTVEAMGSPHYAATLYASRSVATLGLWIQFSAPLGHSGAMFPWTLELSASQPVRVYPGMVIGKIAFWTMTGQAASYAGRYAGSTTAVASRLSSGWATPAGSAS